MEYSLEDIYKKIRDGVLLLMLLQVFFFLILDCGNYSIKSMIKKNKIEVINIHMESYIESLYDAGVEPCEIESIKSFQTYTNDLYEYTNN